MLLRFGFVPVPHTLFANVFHLGLRVAGGAGVGCRVRRTFGDIPSRSANAGFILVSASEPEAAPFALSTWRGLATKNSVLLSAAGSTATGNRRTSSIRKL
jgi:hypothetical protein